MLNLRGTLTYRKYLISQGLTKSFRTHFSQAPACDLGMFLSEGQRLLGMPDISVIFLTGVCGNVWMIVEEERMS